MSFDFPISGNISTWTALFFQPESNYIVYTHPVDSSSAQQLCVKGTVFFPGAQQTGEIITDTFFWSLSISDDDGNVVYLLKNGDQICPAFTQNECTTADEIDLRIDTEAANNLFGLGADTAGACFFLTITGNPNTDPNPLAKGLLDTLEINTAQAPVAITIEATIGVNFQGAKRRITAVSTVPLPDQTTYAQTSVSLQMPTAHHTNSATSFCVNIFTVIFALVLSLMF